MTEKLDLNAAPASVLEKLPTLTRTLANRIVAQRKARGGFLSVEELRAIDGVTDETLAALADAVFVAAPDAAPAAQVTVELDPARRHRGRFGGYTIVAAFQARSSLAGTGEEVLVPRALATAPDADGLASLAMPALATIGGLVSFTVRAPDGETVARADKPPAELARPVALPVVPREPPLTQPTASPAFGRPTRLRGRVIDRAGRVQIAARQVVVWGAQKAQPADADFRPLMAAETDATGYFSGAYPLEVFTAAHAVVALEPPQAVSIHLGEDGTLPGDLILVVDAPRRLIDAGEADCGCKGGVQTLRDPEAGDLVKGGAFSADVGQGRCVDFTRPDRTLQEFSYSYVVRTTEPAIKGLTLQDPPKIPPKLLAEIAKLTQFDRLAKAAGSAPGDNAALAMRAGTAAPLAGIEMDAALLRKFAFRPDRITGESLDELARTSRYLDILRALDKTLVREPGRGRLTCANSVDWDDDPTVYQACTIAHGHILHFKQEWIADGYSMGRVLYSLPLAPGQKKQIAVLDWERRESAVRQESLEEQESLVASISRDRDIGEMVNAVLTESARGGSSASTGGFGAGLGIGAIIPPVGGLLGIGGGFSSASSSAWQNSSRNVSASTLQTLRDRTSQAAAAMRAQRSTVIQTVSQGERVAVTTETVANYNHCHALTIQYFEVLRHLLVRQRLVDVQECLFVPLQMSRFDRAKSLRWRHTLRDAVGDRALRAGFDAIERIDAGYVGSDFPVGSYADQPLELVEGDLSLRFQLARPRDKDDDFDPSAWTWMGLLLPFINPQEQYRNFLKDQRFKDRVFLEQYGPKIARAFVDLLKVSWIDAGHNEHALPIDTTLLSNFANDSPLAVSLRLGDALAGIPRKDIRFVKISERSRFGPFLVDVLPQGSRVIVEGGSLSYRTKHSTGWLFRSSRIANDLTAYDAVRIPTPLNAQELRNPREEDKELARRLLDHLNEHLERYHHALWWRMSPDRRYMLLDGFEAPGSGGRSVASVVDNSLIGIVGNCLVMPVSRGYHLDPTFGQDKERPVDLLEHYQPNTPIEPVRVAIPTRGVYAEAVMGACNSCEVKEEQRFWRWEESPIPDQPPAILPTSTDTRRAEPPDLRAKDFPQPIIAMQNAPAAPDPGGLGAALSLLGQANAFRDMAGLAGTQQNALEAFKQSMATAQFFGEKAGNLALQGRMAKDIDKTMRSIESARQQGLLTDDQARTLTQSALQSMIGGGPATEPKPMSTADVGSLTQTAGANAAQVKVSRPGGEQVEVDARPASRDADAAPRPRIVFDTGTASAERRAFQPATHDISGAIDAGIEVPNAPPGLTVRWTPAEPEAVEVLGAQAQVTRLLGKRPGLTRVDVAVFDGGTAIATSRLQLCVPQFVSVSEDAGAFDGVLAQLKIDTRKVDVLKKAREVCRHLLRTANARTVWLMAPFNEKLPAHLAANRVTRATIKGEPPASDPRTFGWEIPTAAGDGPTVHDETIELFPGAYDNPMPPGVSSATWVDTETQALLMDIQGQAAPPAALLDFAVEVMGRLIGETLAHEIVHSLLGDMIPGGGHNNPAIPNDLMNFGSDRHFRQRTGFEDKALVSPVDPANFTDHGIASIGGLQVANQARVDSVFPVPPKFA